MSNAKTFTNGVIANAIALIAVAQMDECRNVNIEDADDEAPFEGVFVYRTTRDDHIVDIYLEHNGAEHEDERWMVSRTCDGISMETLPLTGDSLLSMLNKL